jgi:hypothetical protein
MLFYILAAVVFGVIGIYVAIPMIKARFPQDKS